MQPGMILKPYYLCPSIRCRCHLTFWCDCVVTVRPHYTLGAPVDDDICLDSHMSAGALIPPFYDSMMGKLIVHGSDRADAIAKLAAALDAFRVEGVPTTIDLHRAIVSHPDFIAKNGGSINPMRALEISKVLPLADELGQTIVKAPYVSTIVYVDAVGAVVPTGEVVARLRVLGTVEDIVASVSGRIVVTYAKVGALVEFDASIVALIRLASLTVENQPRN